MIVSSCKMVLVPIFKTNQITEVLKCGSLVSRSDVLKKIGVGTGEEGGD